MRKLVSCAAVALCALSAPVSSFAQKPAFDSTSSVPKAIADSVVSELKTPAKGRELSFRSIAIPTGMIALGGLTLCSSELKKANLFARSEVYSAGDEKRMKIDYYTAFAPAVAVYALNAAGVKGKNNFLDRTMIYAMSSAICNTLVFSGKNLTHVLRPDSSQNVSFPSGHTAQAFVSAEFMRQEFKGTNTLLAISGYAAAVATGYLRMYHNRHWLNDVVAGAGVGILSTRISYWLYPTVKNALFHNNKKGTMHTMIMPTYEGGAVGVAMVHTF